MAHYIVCYFPSSSSSSSLSAVYNWGGFDIPLYLLLVEILHKGKRNGAGFVLYIYKYIFFLVTYVLSFSFFLPFFFSFDLTGSIGKKCIVGYPFLFPFFFFCFDWLFNYLCNVGVVNGNNFLLGGLI